MRLQVSVSIIVTIFVGSLIFQPGVGRTTASTTFSSKSSSAAYESSAAYSSSSSTELECCKPPYSFFDCTGAGHVASPGKTYTCVSSGSMKGCMACLQASYASEEGTCDTCCAIESDAQCAVGQSKPDWAFYIATLFFVCVCCCFSVVCGFTEARRKKKGISFAQAWSVPRGIPVLRTIRERSASAPDVSEHSSAVVSDEVLNGWTALPEEDLKHLPVAGLVDDTSMAVGMAASLPQQLLNSVTSSFRRQGLLPPPTVPSEMGEPEVTVWVSSDGAYAEATAAPPRHLQGGEGLSDAAGRRHSVPVPVGGSSRRGSTGSGLQEPLILSQAPSAGASSEVVVTTGTQRERVSDPI